MKRLISLLLITVFSVSMFSEALAIESKEEVSPTPKPISVVRRNGRYKVYKNGKATFFRVKRKKLKTIVILNTVKRKGKKYKVSQISSKAFSKCKKLRTIKVYCRKAPKIQKGAFSKNTRKITIKVTRKMSKKEFKKFKKNLKKIKFKGSIKRI